MLKIELYGSDMEGWRCPACYDTKKLLDENHLSYIYYPVVNAKGDTFEFNFDNINNLRDRLKVNHRCFTYPQIFVNNKCIGGLKQLREYLEVNHGIF